ncbi:SET and MYND domain-containing protein 4-like [Bradysia coprophila]|uniref:SET and MYND domain-containing protein 4-like n=1 Tax=Bradysia coprophila TaxID=38358 RepID=UPI00187DBB69|nr:SET and MYND domain-containing protein 4-like [Bradysia coprophila]
MSVAQYTQKVLANLPCVNGKSLMEFYKEMLLKISAMQRLDFLAETIDEQSDFLPTIDWSNGKNDEKSQQFRYVGNECFTRFEFVEALKWYNKALAHAKSKENIGVCYANRSAAYFKLSMFKACMVNVRAALNYVLSDRLKAKLYQRYVRAQDELLATGIKPQERNIIELSRPAKGSQPFYINCLSKQRDAIVTSEPLQPGDVISLEKPYSQILSQSHVYERCTYCLTNKAYLSMIPCPNCSSAMFCSGVCYKMAMKVFHHFECPMIDGLYNFLPDSMYLGLRTVFTSFHECNWSMDDYQNRIIMCFGDETEPFDVNVTEPGETANEKVFLMIHNMTRSFNFSMEQHVAVVVVAEKLKSLFGSLFNRDAITAIMFSVSIFHMIQVSQEHGVLLEETAFSGDGVGNDITTYGCGMFPFASNFKLSCAPNVLLLNNNGTLIGFAMTKINRNEPIELGLMSRNHFLTDMNRRSERSKTFSGRCCHCTACEEDFELYTDIQPFDGRRYSPPIPVIAEKCLKFTEIVRSVKFILYYLNTNRNLPYISREVGWCIQAMIQLLRQLVQAYDTDLMFTEYSRLIRND